uniref:Methyltransferase HEMK2 n=2 Tax=Biomphalaria glabrata TaxID=6526 RepID=A0A2C9L4Z7_BIOGL
MIIDLESRGLMSTNKFRTPVIGLHDNYNYDDVYEPAEDSFLLLDVLEQEFNFLSQLKPNICLEVGCGSGICITFLSQILEKQALFLCTDINPAAIQLTLQTAERNWQRVEPVLCDLTGAFEDRLKGKVDVLIFNPPYVVTSSGEVANGGIAASWAGGIKGREVIDRFLPKVSLLLSSTGVFYMVIIKENDQDDIEQVMLSQGLKMTVAGSRRAGCELLFILKFTRLPER